MNGKSLQLPDKSDQILAMHDLLRKRVRWWKTIVFHLKLIATVSSFILFKILFKLLFKHFLGQNPNNKQLQQKRSICSKNSDKNSLQS